MDRQLIIQHGPHARSADTTQKIMFRVVIALIPAIAAGSYFFGWHALYLVLVAAAAAIAAEALCQVLRAKPITIWDGSALVTGILVGLSVPPTLPPFMVVLGSTVAIVLGKHVFGGLGHNPFNPALVGRAFLTYSFVVPMTRWTTPFDGITSATPLATESATIADLFFGSVSGSIGETSALAILIGGLYLIIKGVIDYRVPLGFVGTTAVVVGLFGQDVLFHVLAGSLLLGAVFMATDMVTSPVTPSGRWVYAFGAGLILAVIRLWGSLPEGLTFAILIMNGLTPLINRWTRPRIYGREVVDHV